ncbi:MAG: DNA-protecting protein DprA [Rickettsiales bacterium]|nr:DNA-protecting protein DprA [Rickettsiales bacterium]
MDDLFHKLLILRTPRVGPVKYAELVEKFGSVAAVVDSLHSSDAHIDSVKREMDAAARIGIRYISDDSQYYPENLRCARNHPPVISVCGNLETLQKRTIAIVGTRHATAAGMRIVSDLARAFAENNCAVASGMAAGTDAAAHAGALAACGDAQTIAVLAGGADYIWPPENEKLYRQICERGCVVSEMPVGFTPVATNFIQRNRWIAGLSEMLILGEADEKSGSRATAEFMLGYARRVYAIPGHPLDARSIGPNRLIKSGRATLCVGPDDFFIRTGKEKKGNNVVAKQIAENEILDRLGNIPVTESVLAELVKKNVFEIKRELVMLELGGFVKRLDGGYVKA